MNTCVFAFPPPGVNSVVEIPGTLGRMIGAGGITPKPAPTTPADDALPPGVATVKSRAPIGAVAAALMVTLTLVGVVALIVAVTPAPVNVTAVAQPRLVPDITAFAVLPWLTVCTSVPVMVAPGVGTVPTSALRSRAT